jgi:hypothetical protein
MLAAAATLLLRRGIWRRGLIAGLGVAGAGAGAGGASSAAVGKLVESRTRMKPSGVSGTAVQQFIEGLSSRKVVGVCMVAARL